MWKPFFAFRTFNKLKNVHHNFVFLKVEVTSEPKKGRTVKKSLPAALQIPFPYFSGYAHGRFVFFFRGKRHKKRTRNVKKRLKIEIHTLPAMKPLCFFWVCRDLRSFTYQQTQTERILRNVIVMTSRTQKGWSDVEFSVIMCVENGLRGKVFVSKVFLWGKVQGSLQAVKLIIVG